MRGVNGVRVDIERRSERCVAQPLFRFSPAPGVVEQGRVDVAELMPVPYNNSIRLLRRAGGQCNWAGHGITVTFAPSRSRPAAEAAPLIHRGSHGCHRTFK